MIKKHKIIDIIGQYVAPIRGAIEEPKDMFTVSRVYEKLIFLFPSNQSITKSRPTYEETHE